MLISISISRTFAHWILMELHDLNDFFEDCRVNQLCDNVNRMIFCTLLKMMSVSPNVRKALNTIEAWNDTDVDVDVFNAVEDFFDHGGSKTDFEHSILREIKAQLIQLVENLEEFVKKPNDTDPTKIASISNIVSELIKVSDNVDLYFKSNWTSIPIYGAYVQMPLFHYEFE
jgi:hypothetical protein